MILDWRDDAQSCCAFASASGFYPLGFRARSKKQVARRSWAGGQNPSRPHPRGAHAARGRRPGWRAIRRLPVLLLTMVTDRLVRVRRKLGPLITPTLRLAMLLSSEAIPDQVGAEMRRASPSPTRLRSRPRHHRGCATRLCRYLGKEWGRSWGRASVQALLLGPISGDHIAVGGDVVGGLLARPAAPLAALDQAAITRLKSSAWCSGADAAISKATLATTRGSGCWII